MKAQALKGAGYMLLGASLIQWSAVDRARASWTDRSSRRARGASFLGAIVLMAFTRPDLRSWTKATVAGLCPRVSVAFMNHASTNDREDPLGAAVAIAVPRPVHGVGARKRSARHFAFVNPCRLGVLAIARPGAAAQLRGRTLRGRFRSRVGLVRVRRAPGRGTAEGFGTRGLDVDRCGVDVADDDRFVALCAHPSRDARASGPGRGDGDRVGLRL